MTVVAQLVLGGVVPSLFLDQLETAAFARIGRIEDAGIKFDAFTQTFDDGEALMILGALDHLDHVIDLGGVGVRDEGGAAGDELFIGFSGRLKGATLDTEIGTI